MDLSLFKETLSGDNLPENLSVYLKALWHDARGEWDKAHNLIQDINSTDASWIHAYLHRKEGDIGNADYWYHRAHKERPQVSLEQEWDEIVCAFL